MKIKDNKPTAVLLLNLGGPDSLAAVRPFLYNLFSDREIIRLGPAFMQKPLAYLISTLRHKKTEGYYSLIGGKSPILEITMAQAEALENELNSSRFTIHDSRRFKVYLAMRYWHPLIEEVVPRIHKEGFERVIALGLYPHYSIATTGSSISRLMDVAAGLPLRIFSITSWFDNPLYIEALEENIRRGVDAFGLPPHDIHLLFSAHSLPKKFIEEGDPYVDHIKGTIREITKVIDMPWSLSYQSKSGPVEWLEPSTERMLEELANKGVKNLLVVPISFVSDHIETLYEIDILYRRMAQKLGMRLERVESLNTSPLFISALKNIVLRGMEEARWA